MRYIGFSHEGMDMQFWLGHFGTKFTLGSVVIDFMCGHHLGYADEVMPSPTTAAHWTRIADGFRDSWNFPNTLGAIDGYSGFLLQPEKPEKPQKRLSSRYRGAAEQENFITG
ncbi:hypothetical protein DPMN_092958 [Dreissena polymorpha]|uniref:FBA domain-containing protein n=1 Tax=Dreissena polymorpha TaxID=45954 RepID=A0A9D4R1D3_DREPO|nr:hypothetical protein DPMN_092958 [Dreissena polymorpha]